MYTARVPIDVMEGFITFLRKRGITTPRRFSDYNMQALSSSLSLGMSETEMTKCLTDLLHSNNITTISSMFLHYTGDEIILPLNSIPSIIEFISNSLNGNDITDISCIFENPTRCKICYEATNTDIITSILQHIDLISFFSYNDSRIPKILDKVIQYIPVIVERIISNPQAISSPFFMNSSLNKDNQLLLFHLRRDNLGAVRKALYTKVNGRDLILVNGRDDPLYLEFMKSKHSTTFKSILSNRASFRALSE